MTSITKELQAYIPIGQDISSRNRDSILGFIENIIKELAATRRSLPFVTSEFAHRTMEKCLGEDEAFCFVVKCSLATDQPVHSSDEPSNEEEAATQVQPTLTASFKMAREEPYVPFKRKSVVEDTEPPSVTSEGASLSVWEVGGSSHAYFEQEPWNPPSLTPAGEHV